MGKAMTEKNVALILAAGKGVRLGKGKEKAFLPLLGKPLLAWTLSAFTSFPSIHEIIVVVPPGREEDCRKEVLSPYGIEKARIVVGGSERQDSLQNGFAEIEEPCDAVVVHDGARPFLDQEILRKALDAAREHGASVVAVPVKDTIKRGDARRMVETTLDRSHLWSVQTPQTYKYDILKRALAEAKKADARGTDDASLVERIGEPVKIVTGSYENIKITTPEDLVLGEMLLESRLRATKQ
jgi:2-C-methyl-D-erythritol 4-phosphate cytidylyltransferase